MAIQNGYTTLAEFKDWVPNLDDSMDDLNLERAVTAVSRGIDHYCQRHFWQATEARVFDTDDSTAVDLGYFNDLQAVTDVKTDENDDGIFETTWSAGDYQLLPIQSATAPEPRPYRRIRSTGNRWFPTTSCVGRVGLVEVTGTWGWPEVPEAVQQACLIRTHQVFKRRETPQGLAGTGEFGMIRISRFTDPDVASLLDPYRLTAVLVA